VTALAATASFPALGTSATVAVTDPDQLDIATALLRDHADQLDLACSRFRDDSELTRINDRAGRGAVPVSPLLLRHVAAAVRAARITAGRVDPTVGVALETVGYDRDFASVAPDGPPLQIVARPIPGWSTVIVDEANATIALRTGVRLDLGATAKALCADDAAAAIAAESGCGVLVSLGGDVAVAGPPPTHASATPPVTGPPPSSAGPHPPDAGRPPADTGATPPGGWPVHISEHHADPLDGPGPVVTISAGGLASSSPRARRWIRGGREMHHLIDPATSEPATGYWSLVSVAAATCLGANIASCAAVVLGPGAAGWLGDLGLPARLVTAGGKVTTVAGWPDEVALCS
jgi:thiamine biosynthesis lipoprotein